MRLLTTIACTLSFAILCQTALGYAPGGDKKKKKKDGATQQQTPGKQQSAKLERLLLDAEKAKVTDDMEAAIKAYQAVLAVDGNNANAHFQLAQIYQGKNKTADAEREALAAVKADGTNKWYLELLSSIYLSQGKAKDALETYKTLIEKFPNNPEYYLDMAFVYSKLGQYENAIKIYDQFEKNFGLDEQVVIEKRNLYLHLNKFNEAVNEVHKLVDAFPGEAEYLLQEADLYRMKHMNEKAAELYNEILKLEPDNPQAQLGLAEVNSRDGSPEKKKESLQDIFSNPKVNIDTKVSILLISYIQMNNEDSAKRKEAIELANILVKVHPDESKAYAVLGDVLYLDKQDDKALETYLKALELNKDVFQVWQQVMLIYNDKRDWASLQKITTDAMELFPNQATVYLFKGGAEVQLKDYEKALKSYSKGEKMSGDNDKLRAQFLANEGDAYHNLNRNEESDSAYEKSLKLDPDNAYVLNNYSYYLSVRKQNLERAKQMSAYANKLDPGNSSFIDTYAWILFQVGDYTSAKDWLEKAMKAGGDKSGTILEHYGDILYKLGKKEDAVTYWHKAKDLGTDSGTIDKKIGEQKYIEQ